MLRDLRARKSISPIQVWAQRSRLSLASVLAREVTVIYGAAKEPEISQLRLLPSHNRGRLSAVCTASSDDTGRGGTSGQQFPCGRGQDCARYLRGGRQCPHGSITLKEVRAAELELPLEMLKRSGASIQKDSYRQVCIRIEMKKRPPAPGHKDWSISGIPNRPSVPLHGVPGIGTGNQHHCGAGV